MNVIVFNIRYIDNVQCAERGIIIMCHKFKEKEALEQELFKKLKAIKVQNPDYYVIGIDDL